MSKLELLKMRLHFAWNVLIGKYEPAPVTPFISVDQKTHKALELALTALDNIGKRRRGGSVSARAAYTFITAHLNAAEVTL